jgi:hypothetical protein
MVQTKYKRIPFNIELAKKIAKGEMKGRITTLDGREARIVCWDKKPIEEYPIVILATNDCGSEMLYTCTEEGLVISCPSYKSCCNLILEIPTYHKDYSNFIPQKNQLCLVRDKAPSKWDVAVCAGKDKNTGKILFYNEYGGTYSWEQILPYSKITSCLIGTNKSYEQLCEELDQKKEKKL